MSSAYRVFALSIARCADGGHKEGSTYVVKTGSSNLLRCCVRVSVLLTLMEVEATK